jgi:hypothetical protein
MPTRRDPDHIEAECDDGNTGCRNPHPAPAKTIDEAKRVELTMGFNRSRN